MIIDITQSAAGSPIEATVDVVALSAIPTDPYYQDTDNWNAVKFSYRSGLQTKNLIFVSDGEAFNLAPVALSAMAHLGVWTLIAISIEDYDGGVLVLTGSQIPSGLDMTVGTPPPVSNTMLLMHFDATPWVDSSHNSYPITAGGAMTLDSSGKFSDCAWCPYSDNIHDYLVVDAANPDTFALTGDTWTVECFVRVDAGSGWFPIEALLSRWGAGSSKAWNIALRSVLGGTSSAAIRLTFNGGTDIYQTPSLTPGAAVPADGAYHHIAVVKNFGSLKIFIDGVTQGSWTGVPNMQYDASDGPMRIGYQNIVESPYSYIGLYGRLDELRISDIAVYTADFTPPAAPFTD
jgi:hypothetical protein